MLFHILFALFIAFSAYYLTGIVMSLLKRLTRPKFESLYTIGVLVLVYIVAIFLCGLNKVDPVNLLWFLPFIMATFVFIGIIWWCIEHYDLQMVAFWFIVFIFALTFTLTYISALYPEIYEFFVNLYGSFGKFV